MTEENKLCRLVADSLLEDQEVLDLCRRVSFAD